MKKTILGLSLCLLSQVALAQTSLGGLNSRLSLNTKTIQLPEANGEIKIIKKPGIDHVSVTLNVAAENNSKLKDYVESWTLRASGSDNIKLEVAPIGMFASQNCSKTVFFGVSKLKGVCIEGLTILVPEELNPKLSSNKKMLILRDTPAQTVTGLVNIPRESMQDLSANIKNAPFDCDKEEVLKNFVDLQKLSGANHIEVADLMVVIKAVAFDDDKLLILTRLSPYITERAEAYMEIEKELAFPSNKDKAHSILLK